MTLSVVTNIASVNAVRQFNNASADINTSMQRLTTGLRINSAKDDAAGMQITSRFTSQINGLSIAQRNANDGISIAQTAESSMQESTAILLRMRDLSLQSANPINGLADRAALQKEVQDLQQQLTFIAETTKFGNHNLLDGSYGTKKIQVGSNANETVNITLRNMAADTIGAHQLSGEPAHAGFNNVGVLLAGKFGVDDALTIDNWNINGTDISLPSGDAAATIADTINNAMSKIDATAILETRIQNLTAADTGTITLSKGFIDNISGYTPVDSFNLADYGGNMEKLTDDLNANGYQAEYDATLNGGAGGIKLKAVGVDGIDISNSATVELEKNGTSIAASAHVNGVHQGAELHLSSSDKISISGNFVNHYLDMGVSGIAGHSGGSSTLTSIEDIDISGEYATGAQAAIDVIDAALGQIDGTRAQLGALQNRLSHAVKNLANITENVSASRSRIQDTDFAKETAILTKSQIMQQAGTSILSQVNQLPNTALSLL